MTKRKEYFAKRDQMFHYAASADYDGGYIRSANAHVNGNEVWSYATKVAEFDKKKEILLYTGHYYSQTTSNTMWDLRRAFEHYDRLMVYDFNLRDAWERLQDAVKLHSKHPATRKDDKEFFIKTVDSFKNLVKFYGKNDRRVKSKTMQTATAIVSKYLEQIEEKRKKAEERWARIRAEEERKRKERIDNTIAIIKEYMPDYDSEPKTFKECMSKHEITIPVGWMKEHHPELFINDGVHTNPEAVCFRRGWDYTKFEYTGDFTFREDRDDVKLLRHVCRYGGPASYTPDILVYEKDTKMLKTSQNCEVDDTNGHCKNLLGLLLKAVDEGKDTSFVVGRHCGPYDIREYNTEQQFLRVGCHCFLLENLREVYEDMEGV